MNLKRTLNLLFDYIKYLLVKLRFISRYWQELVNSNRLLAAKVDDQGQDLQVNLQINFHEAIRGCQKKIKFKYLEVQTNGNKRTTIKTAIINIPPGVEYGTRLLVDVDNLRINHHHPCHLYVFISVPRGHGNCTRDGIHLFSQLEINRNHADLGGEFSVKTIDGIRMLTVPSGTQNGDYVTLIGCGVQKMGSPIERGNHIFRIAVESIPDFQPQGLATEDLSQSSLIDRHVNRDIQYLLDDLVKCGWSKDELAWTSKFYLEPRDLANSSTLEQTVEILLDHARQVVPKFNVPYMVPRVVVKSMSDGVGGQFVVDQQGWVTISVSPNFFYDQAAADAILVHEICHYLLENLGISRPDVELNERYTDLCMFVCGFGQIFPAGYKRNSVQNDYRIGHRLGYLSDAEYQFANRYVGEIRTSHQRRLYSPLVTLRRQLLELNRNDAELVNRLIEYERSKNPMKSEIFLYQAAIDRLWRDRR
jgi:DnaJ C terminal domain